MAQRFFKQSAALEDYDFDWSGWLVGDDFITSYSVVADEGVTLGTVMHQKGSPVIKQFVSGGAHGNSYKVTCTIVTDQGRSDMAQIILLIRDIGTGGQPIAPPIAEIPDIEMPAEILDLTLDVFFLQPGVVFHTDDWSTEHDSVIITKTGQIVTISWAISLSIMTGTAPLPYLLMTLPPGFHGFGNHGYSGNYAYNLSNLPVPPYAPNRAGSVYIDPFRTGNDRLAFYPNDWSGFPPDNYFLTGQMTYVAEEIS